MARLIPPVAAPGLKSSGEAVLHQRFLTEAGTEGWVVLHSLDLPQHVRQVTGEADFVVLVPREGIVVLEVKGVEAIRRDEGIWRLGRYGTPDVRGPFRQAADAMHSIRKRLAGRVPASKDVLWSSAVVFPFIPFDLPPSEWHDWQVIDEPLFALLGLPDAIIGHLQKARAHLANTSPGLAAAGAGRPGGDELRAIAQALRGDFEVFESPRSRVRRIEQDVLRFTREQFQALDSMADNDRVVFNGPAGSGKTVLAVEAARREGLRGHRILMLCFNRGLARHLQAELSPSGNVEVATLHGKLLEIARLPAQDSEDFWSKELPAKALEILVESVPAYDVLIIDEAQDLATEAYLDCLDMLVSGGLAQGRWRCFGDLISQRLYLPDVDLYAMLNNRGVTHARFRLTVNCRNTPRVATIAGLIGAVPECYENARRPDDGVEPVLLLYGDADEQGRLLRDQLEGIYRDGFRGDAIAILSPSAAGPCASRLGPPWRDRIGSLDSIGPGHLRTGTIHAFKGLEAPVVVLTDVESLAAARDRNLVYVGCTRSIQRLVILARRDAFASLPHLAPRKAASIP